MTFIQEIADAFVFDIDSVTMKEITEFKEYHRIYVSAVGHRDRTKFSLVLIVYPNVVKMELPVILGMEPPIVNVYSLELSIAEKLEASFITGIWAANLRFITTCMCFQLGMSFLMTGSKYCD